MIRVTGILLVTGVLVGTSIASRSSCQTFQIGKNNLHKVLVGHSVLEINDTYHYECARTCMSLAICESIDYDTTEKNCKLNDVDNSSVDQSEFNIKKGSIFSNINEWPSAIAEACGSRPCGVNQRCYNDGASYICRDITCDSVHEIKNGKIQGNPLGANNVLDKAEIACNVGYDSSESQAECQASGQWQPATCEPLSDCKEIIEKFPTATSGLYEIELWNSGKLVTVNCDMETEGGGWTVFHRRFDGSVDFYRNFSEYENGFGNAEGELWLGLKYTQELAEQGTTELRLDMTKANDEKGHETFQDFSLTNGINYTLNIGSRSASVGIVSGRGLQYHNGHSFSTFDRDIDSGPTRNCAEDRHGAWWYVGCSYVNLNGLYVTPDTFCTLTGEGGGSCGHVHDGFNGNKGLKSSSMMLKRK